MNTLPNDYRLEDIDWEYFDVNNEYDESYNRLHFNKIEYKSDFFITYLPGGDNLTIDKGRQRRIVIQVNKYGHNAYPGIDLGDGYLVTIYNDDMGSTQLGTKPVRLVAANENYLIFRGYDVLAMGPFGLVNTGNEDYGFAVFLENNCIRKISFHRYDTHKSYEYINTDRGYRQIPFGSSEGYEDLASIDYTDVNYDRVKKGVDAFIVKLSQINSQEQTRLARETDRIFNAGVIHWNNGDRTTALKYFAEALQVYPINTDVIGLYGDYYEYSDYDLSMKFYELAINLKSLRKKDYYQLANFYKWKGYYDKANRCYAMWEQIKIRYGINDD